MPQSFKWIIATTCVFLTLTTCVFLTLRYTAPEGQTIDHATCPSLDVREFGEIEETGWVYRLRTHDRKTLLLPVESCVVDENLPLTDSEYKAYLETGKP